MTLTSGAALATALFVSVLLGSVVPSAAKESVSELDRCLGTAPAGDLPAKDCYVAQAQRNDVRLNREWSRLMKQVGGAKTPVGNALTNAQRAWLRYRDAACVNYVVDGGTLDRLLGQMCYTNLVATRADELARLAEHYSDY